MLQFDSDDYVGLAATVLLLVIMVGVLVLFVGEVLR